MSPKPLKRTERFCSPQDQIQWGILFLCRHLRGSSPWEREECLQDVWVEVPYRAQRGDRCVIKRNVGIARRQPHRRQIVHAADAHAALDDIRRQAEIAWPVRRQRDGSEMPAGGLATDIDSVPVTTEVRGILVYPGDGATDLISKHHKAAADILHPGEVRHDIMRTGDEERLGRARELLRAAA